MAKSFFLLPTFYYSYTEMSGKINYAVVGVSTAGIVVTTPWELSHQIKPAHLNSALIFIEHILLSLSKFLLLLIIGVLICSSRVNAIKAHSQAV